MKPSKKMQKRLELRLRGYTQGIEYRKMRGISQPEKGYHIPGSRNTRKKA